MSELDDVREQLVQRLERADALSGKEILATTLGGMLAAAGAILTLAGLGTSAAAVAVGLVLLVGAGLALSPWVRNQRALWRDVGQLRQRERQLLAQLPDGTDPGPGVLRRYYRRRLAPPVAAVALVAALLLVLRLSD